MVLGGITTTSNALDLEPKSLHPCRSARIVAMSLKRSAERSRRRKGATFQTAMSVTFYMNRAGKKLSAERKRLLSGPKTTALMYRR
jgi:hypothetical protein